MSRDPKNWREPNLQNIPIRTSLGREIREAFLPKKRSILEDVDYSEIEKRLAEQLKKDGYG